MNVELMIMNIIIVGALVCLYNIVKNINPIYSVLNLIVMFVCYSSMLILLDQEFLACIFILVNVGAVAVLFLFIIMMINITMVEIKENMKKYLPYITFMGLNIFMFLFIIGSRYMLTVPENMTEHVYEQFFTQLAKDNELSLGNVMKESYLININYVNIYELFIKTTDIKNIGANILYSSNSLWFVLACLMLLIAMVGVINLTDEFLNSTRFKGNKSQNLFHQISCDYVGNVKYIREIKTKN
uniref:NADH-ubiquinone oxidoreductase chain 6 n=1 Tax=Cavenderia fasciculata TaxID=261658 RepID=B2XX77_CACFS|nr:NADH dehydrogenase subunit 6 [Cavenderia fasciculata]ABX45199.1 NADH dehydrogenase subunit 6 [Cavenderia fasciculata]